MKNSLITSVIKQLGYSSKKDSELLSTLRDISNYGIQGGYGGFVYYSDTVNFYDANKKDIIALANESAECIGYSLGDTATAKKLRELENEARTDKDMKQVKDFLFRTFDGDAVAMILNFGGWKNVGDLDQLKNLMSWFAAEECARELTDN